ncbi:MAG: hypothetical protein DRO99_03685, partial [Candidatus Aenigmatarchaeota archaeon]
GRFIHMYQEGEYDLDVRSQVLIYMADFAKDAEKVRKWLDGGRTVVLDRYVTTTMAYQGIRGFPVDGIVRLAEAVGLPAPDVILYLDITPRTSRERKMKEKGKLDRNESDSKLLENLRGFYAGLIEKGVFGKWERIDGSGTKECVFGKVKELLGL